MEITIKKWEIAVNRSGSLSWAAQVNGKKVYAFGVVYSDMESDPAKRGTHRAAPAPGTYHCELLEDSTSVYSVDWSAHSELKTLSGKALADVMKKIEAAEAARGKKAAQEEDDEEDEDDEVVVPKPKKKAAKSKLR